jgi:hypothetical protein
MYINNNVLKNSGILKSQIIFVSGCLQVEKMNKLKNVLHFYRSLQFNCSNDEQQITHSLETVKMKYSGSGHCHVPEVDIIRTEYNVYMSVCFTLSVVCILLVVKRKHLNFNSNHNAFTEISE